MVHPPAPPQFFIQDLYHLYRDHRNAVSVRLTNLGNWAILGKKYGAGMKPYPFSLMVFSVVV